MENLARYIIRASFSQERMAYLPEPVVSVKVERESRIIYRSKDHRQEKAFYALEWLAAMTSHLPNQAGLAISVSIAMPPVDFVKKKTKIPSSAKDPLLEFFLEKTFKPPRGDHDERLGFEFSARFG